MAVADATYFDWPVLPEAPSDLTASKTPSGVKLGWALHGAASNTVVERRAGNTGRWRRIASPGAVSTFTDTAPPRGGVLCYRVRAIGTQGESAYSNIVRVR
jgi:hypothetical protein